MTSLSPFVLAELRYDFTGFFQPTDNNGVYNNAKAASAIRVKFRLGGNQGLSIFQNGSPSSTQVACPGVILVDPIEVYTSSPSGLTYDPTANQYIYAWKSGSWAGTCRKLLVRLADGSEHTAYFQFTR